MAFGYVLADIDLKKEIIEIEVEKKKYEAVLEVAPLHDPKNLIMKN